MNKTDEFAAAFAGSQTGRKVANYQHLYEKANFFKIFRTITIIFVYNA